MTYESRADAPPEELRWCAADVERVLVERRWLAGQDQRGADARVDAWLDRAAALLGPHANDWPALIALLEAIFSYDAAELLQRRESQTVLTREGRAK
jgi:glutathione S-transferase